MDFEESFNSGWSYKFKRLLDTGGSADVFLYTRHMDGLPEQEVVLKVLRDPQVNLDELLNEGKRLSELRHPNILSTFGYEKIGPSKFALVLEYVKGKNLREIMLKIKPEDRHNVASFIIRVALEAMQAAHSQKIIHGDISSRNILISDTGQIKLSDFGESRNSGAEVNCGLQRGSVDYLAPERWAGVATSMASDVFALGVLAFELLIGFNPLSGATSKSKVDDFLKEKSWLQFDLWKSFFSSTLVSDPGQRENSGYLLASIPASRFGREKLVGYFKSGDLGDKLTSIKTSTLFISEKALGYLRFPMLKPFIIMLLLINSVAIGTDHTINQERMKPSNLTLTSAPWGEVLIDGVSLGYTPLLNTYLSKRRDNSGFHKLIWRGADGTIVRRTIMDYGNGLFAYQIIKTVGRPIVVAPLMNAGAKEGLEP